jgi:hypothetical protein
LGRYASVDITTKYNRNLRDNGYVDQNGLSMHPTNPRGTVGGDYEKFTCNFGSGTLLGDTITGIVIAYENMGAGTFTANFDDFLIEENVGANAVNEIATNNVFSVRQLAGSGLLALKMNVSGDYLIQVYDVSGVQLLSKKSNQPTETIDLSKYGNAVYVLKITINNKRYYQKIVKNLN